MYRRPRPVSPEQARGEHGSKYYDIPSGTPVLAARAGVVWSFGESLLGWNVIIDHGKPFATLYQHLDVVSAIVRQGRGTPIVAGTRLGQAGYGNKPGDGAIRHLHFALWVGGGEASAVDPEPRMGSWALVGPL